MALNAKGLRRVLSLSSSLITYHRHRVAITNSLSSHLQNLISCASHIPPTSPSFHRFFQSSQPSLSSLRSFNDVDKIDPDTILFEGCDYKHWLIVMDFGKDPQQRPSAEEMVETYVQTLAKVVGSVEEAKKKIYACSTTTYTGFQAEIDEETSQKLEDMPGVIFVLPDSYIDPVNKEYGGDKYINGTIIPRPPPAQYGRMNRGRQNDQSFRGQMPKQGNYTYNRHGSMPGEGSGYIPQSGSPEQQKFPANSGPTSYGGRNNSMSNRTNYSDQGRDHYQSHGNTFVPHQHGNYNHGMPHAKQENYDLVLPPHQGNYNQNTAPHQGSYNHGVASQQGNYNHGYTHGDQGSYIQREQVNNRLGDYGYNYPQGQMRNVHGDHRGYTPPQGQMGNPGNVRDYAPPPPATGANGQSGFGSFEQCGAGQHGRGSSGTNSQGSGIGYDPGYTSRAENQTFSKPLDQPNIVSRA